MMSSAGKYLTSTLKFCAICARV
uniref:Uncharacterized protein n=1 Tax=Rhizophora mucronata TaxID=61149 RepID=A0A2P2QFI2_RHIMU